MAHDAFVQLRSRLAALLETDEAEAIGALLQGLALRHDELASQRDELTSQRDELTSQRDELTSQSDELAFTIQRRDVEIARLRQLLWGRRSEKLTPEELSQLTLSYGGTEAEASLPEPLLPVPEQGDTEPEEAERPPKKRRPNHKGRSPIGPGVERIVNEVLVPEGEHACTCCGATMQVLDYVEHVRVEYVPAFENWVDDLSGRLGKTGKLSEAVRYAKQQRPYVRRCFSSGEFRIDNGAVERDLFTGSAEAGERLACAYTLVQTCRALGISTRDYLVDVITKLESGWPTRRLAELLPHRWAAAQNA